MPGKIAVQGSRAEHAVLGLAERPRTLLMVLAGKGFEAGRLGVVSCREGWLPLAIGQRLVEEAASIDILIRRRGGIRTVPSGASGGEGQGCVGHGLRAFEGHHASAAAHQAGHCPVDLARRQGRWDGLRLDAGCSRAEIRRRELPAEIGLTPLLGLSAERVAELRP